MSKINKIQVDETTYDIEDLSVPSWAKQESKPTYSYSEIQNTPNLSTVATSGSYNDLSNKPTIPTNSDFTLNGLSEKSYNNLTDKPTIPDVSNFITKDVNNLTYYELKIATGNSIAMSIDSSTYVLTVSLKNSAGTVLNTQTVDLPLETMVVGGSYDSTNKKIILTLKNGQTIEFSVADLVSGLQSEITTTNKLSADLVDDTNTTNKFVSASEKTTWGNKYDKPSGGIPSTDLSSAVQTSLGKADTAIQDISGKQDIIQYSTMPTADSTTIGKIIQYIGTTDSTYTNGYFYIGTTDGTNYSWQQLNVQPSASGNYEETSNKVTSLSSNSTDTQYPSAKCVYDLVGNIATAIDNINGESV